MPSFPRNSSSNSSSATESAPPDTATPTRSPGRIISCFFKLARRRCPSGHGATFLSAFLSCLPVTSHPLPLDLLVLRAHPTTVQAVSVPLRIAVEIVNLVLTFLPTLGILLGLWVCLSAGQGG